MSATETRGQDVHATIEEAAKPAPTFEPSPALVELHATAKRLERSLQRAASFSPRLQRRLAIARMAAETRWAAEVAKFERANPDTGATTNGDES